MQEEKTERTTVRGGGINNKTSNKKWVLGAIFVASIAVIIGTVSYAYFSVDMSDNRDQELVLETGTMRLRFADNDNGVNAQLNLGDSATKLFIIENTGTLPAKAKINFANMINTYQDGSLTYKLEMATSEDSLVWSEVQASKNVPVSSTATTKTLVNNLEIPVGAMYYYRLTVTLENLDDVDQTVDINAIFSTEFNLEEASEELEGSAATIANLGITPNYTEPQGSVPNFTLVATTDEGIYALEDDYGISYYYRGASENNYIKYGQDKNGNDMYWRIIRINGDGSLRIIYDGTQAYENGVANDERYAITGQPFNAKYDDAKYVGWMFGGAQGETSTSKEQAQTNETNSDAKTAVDNWYKENIVDTGYSDNVEDAIFCNDRTTPGRAATGYTSDTGLGYAKNATAYGAYARLINSANNSVPQFICEEKNDAFTVYESEKGNGALTYPVGLITADEIVAAGGSWGTANTSYYLYKSASDYGWSLSPYYTDTYGYSNVFYVKPNGGLSNHYVNFAGGALAPVINLSADYVSTLTGDGSASNPYVGK